MHTIIEALQKAASDKPATKAFTYLTRNQKEININYAELDQKAREFAALLQSKANFGSRVVIMYPPGIDFVIAFFAVAYAGMIAVPIMPPITFESSRKLGLIINNAKPALCLTTHKIFQGIKANVQQTDGHHSIKEKKLLQMDWIITDEIYDLESSNWQFPSIHPDTLLFLQYTSGSTGDPKGVMVSHGNLMHNLTSISYALRITPEDSIFSWLPPYHDMGLIGCILNPVYSGIHTVLISPLRFLQQPFCWLEGITRFQSTLSAGPNFAYELCVRKIKPEEREQLKLQSWRVAVNSAEPIRYSTLNKFVQTFQPYGFHPQAFHPGYGLAESILYVTSKSKSSLYNVLKVDKEAFYEKKIIFPTSEKNLQILVSSGDLDNAIKDQQILIVDPNSKEPLGPEKIGEIWVKSPSVAQGYWEHADSKAIFAAHTAAGEGPFLRTGDIGFIYQDQLYIAGRLKDMIIIRGLNYYPQDIELSVETCHPLIRCGCVVAFSVEIEQQEQLVILAEVKDQSISANLDDLTAAEIFSAIRTTVNQKHHLKTFAINLLTPSTILKTTSGKLRRSNMRTMFLQERLKPLKTWSLYYSKVGRNDGP